jgi:hypothetical protein
VVQAPVGHIWGRYAGHIVATAFAIRAHIETVPRPTFMLRQTSVLFGPAPTLVYIAALAAAVSSGAAHQRHLPGEFTHAIAKGAQAVAPAVRPMRPVGGSFEAEGAIAIARAIAGAVPPLIAIMLVIRGGCVISAGTPVIARTAVRWPAGRKASCLVWRSLLLIHT